MTETQVTWSFLIIKFRKNVLNSRCLFIKFLSTSEARWVILLWKPVAVQFLSTWLNSCIEIWTMGFHSTDNRLMSFQLSLGWRRVIFCPDTYVNLYNCDKGILLKFRGPGRVFNLGRFQTRSATFHVLFYAGDAKTQHHTDHSSKSCLKIKFQNKTIRNKLGGSLNMFPNFFRMSTFIDSTHMKL